MTAALPYRDDYQGPALPPGVEVAVRGERTGAVVADWIIGMHSIGLAVLREGHACRQTLERDIKLLWPEAQEVIMR